MALEVKDASRLVHLSCDRDGPCSSFTAPDFDVGGTLAMNGERQTRKTTRIWLELGGSIEVTGVEGTASTEELSFVSFFG